MASNDNSVRVLVVMGVAGVGKTTVGQRLAAALDWPFFDADDFHPPENKRKMNSGQPLDDADRAGWLERLRELICDCLAAGRPAVLACSALKAAYRDVLACDARVVFVYLRAPFEVVSRRITARTDHFMNPALLTSQYATLEEPEGALVVDAARPPEEVVEEVLGTLRNAALWGNPES